MNITKTTASYRCKLIIEAYKNWLKKGDYVLDIGSGNGIIAKSLMDNFSLKITGSDIKNYLIYDIPFIEINGKELPFTNNGLEAFLFCLVACSASMAGFIFFNNLPRFPKSKLLQAPIIAPHPV